MKIVVFARRFTNGRWETWEHTCDAQETESVADSAQVKACDRSLFGPPDYADFLDSVRYMFNVARGDANSPRDGDTWVHGVGVDGVIIGASDELRGQFKIGKDAA